MRGEKKRRGERLRAILAGGERLLSGAEAEEVVGMIRAHHLGAKEHMDGRVVVGVRVSRILAEREAYGFEVWFEDDREPNPWCPGWKKIAGYRVSSPRSRVTSALRCEVVDQILALRGAGEHVHHGGKGFAEIAAEWATTEGVALDDLETRRVLYQPGRMGERGLTDDRLAASWRAFHAARASLASLSPGEHAARHRGAR